MQRIAINTNFKLYMILAVYTLLILFGTNIPVFSYAALLFGLVVIIFQPLDINIYTIVFIMHFATIFKISAVGQSFFTYIFLVFILYYCCNKMRISKIELSILGFGLYLVLGQIFLGVGLNITRTIKLVISLELIYWVWKNRYKIIPEKIFQLYIWGVIISSFVSLWGTQLFNINQYVMGKEFRYEGEYLNRFSGLYTDPNYYGVNLIIAACLMIILYHVGKMKMRTFAAGMFALSYFAISTYSKSVFLMLVLPMGLFVYSQYRQRHYLFCAFSLVAAVWLIVLAFSGSISSLDVVFSRLQGKSLNKLTTGRVDLWRSYIQNIIEESKYLMFGRSINYPLLNEEAAHNTYIQLIYYLGIIGTTWLMLILHRMSSIRKQKKNLLNYSVLITILAMYFFLSELFYFDVPFHLILCILVMNFDMNYTSLHYMRGINIKNG